MDTERHRKKTFSTAPDFGKHMNYARFCEIKNLVPLIMLCKTGDDESDPWWKHRGFLNGFNKKRQDILFVSRICALDKTMSALRPR